MTDKDRYLAKNALRLAEGRWDQVITSLTKVPAFVLDPKNHFPCPIHGGKDGFRVFPDFLKTGGCICNTCGSFNNGLSWLMKLTGNDYNTVIRQVVDLLDPPEAAAPRPDSGNGENGDRTEKEEKAEKKEKKGPEAGSGSPEKSPDGHDGGKGSEKPPVNTALYLWHSLSQPIEYGDPASRYFASRGIMCIGRPGKELSYGLKFCPRARVTEQAGFSVYPAIIAAVRDSEGKILTVHKTFLDPKKPGKAGIQNPKRIAALPEGVTITGGAVYFQDIKTNPGIMIVAEGIETALSAWVHYGCRVPAAALLSASFMSKWTPPEGVKRVLIFADRDRPGPDGLETGREAAKKLGQNLAARGIHGNILFPTMEIPEGSHSADWNDVLMMGEEFPRL